MCPEASTAVPPLSGLDVTATVRPGMSTCTDQPQVCELLAKNAWKQVKELLKSASPTNKVSGAAVGEAQL